MNAWVRRRVCFLWLVMGKALLGWFTRVGHQPLRHRRGEQLAVQFFVFRCRAVSFGKFFALLKLDLVFNFFCHFVKWYCIGDVKRHQLSFSVPVFGWFEFDHARAPSAAPSQQDCRRIILARVFGVGHGEVQNYLPSVFKAHLCDGCAALLQSMSVHATQLSVTKDALHQKEDMSVFHFVAHDGFQFGIEAVTSGQAAKVVPHVLYTVGDDLQRVDHGMVHDTFHVGATCPDVPDGRILKLLLMRIVHKLLPRGDVCMGDFFNAADIHVFK